MIMISQRKTIPKNFLSLGAGVQSSCLALMATKGELFPKLLRGAIFADTQVEPKKVYDWMEYLKPKLSFPVYTVSKGNLGDDGLVVYTSKKSGKTYIKSLIPAFTLQPDGKKGLLGRKCTADYKVKMIIAQIRLLIGNKSVSEWRKRHRSACKALTTYEKELKFIKAFNKNADKKDRKPHPMIPAWAWDECQADALAVSWIGISTDEADRMKDSKVSWIRNEWPLIEKQMSRQDCLDWMNKNGFPEPPRSACTFCPFHSDDEWRKLRDEQPQEWAKTVQYEKDLQASARAQVALTGIPFLHGDCIPLDKVDLGQSKPGYQQVGLFGNECEGLCGV